MLWCAYKAPVERGEMLTRMPSIARLTLLPGPLLSGCPSDTDTRLRRGIGMRQHDPRHSMRVFFLRLFSFLFYRLLLIFIDPRSPLFMRQPLFPLLYRSLDGRAAVRIKGIFFFSRSLYHP